MNVLLESSIYKTIKIYLVLDCKLDDGIKKQIKILYVYFINTYSISS